MNKSTSETPATLTPSGDDVSLGLLQQNKTAEEIIAASEIRRRASMFDVEDAWTRPPELLRHVHTRRVWLDAAKNEENVFLVISNLMSVIAPLDEKGNQSNIPGAWKYCVYREGYKTKEVEGGNGEVEVFQDAMRDAKNPAGNSFYIAAHKFLDLTEFSSEGTGLAARADADRRSRSGFNGRTV